VSAAGIPNGLAPDRLVTAYELLRQQVVGVSDLESRGAGLTLLLRRGMSAWMEVCARWLSTSASERHVPPTLSQPLAEIPHAEVVVVLASMVRPRLGRDGHDA
jgi:hypothetical protein